MNGMKTPDSTRDEAIDWCSRNDCDFINPVYPPPEGWCWVHDNYGYLYMYFFSMADEDHDDIYPEDAGIDISKISVMPNYRSNK